MNQSIFITKIEYEVSEIYVLHTSTDNENYRVVRNGVSGLLQLFTICRLCLHIVISMQWNERMPFPTNML
jgi:hypothetical protein